MPERSAFHLWHVSATHEWLRYLRVLRRTPYTWHAPLTFSQKNLNIFANINKVSEKQLVLFALPGRCFKCRFFSYALICSLPLVGWLPASQTKPHSYKGSHAFLRSAGVDFYGSYEGMSFFLSSISFWFFSYVLIFHAFLWAAHI